jgi:hypothetical protein
MAMRSEGQAGFSINEVIGAIAGSFMLAAVTTGFVNRTAEVDALSRAARTVLGQVESTRLAAVTTNVAHRLVVAGNRELRVERWDGESRRWNAATEAWNARAIGYTIGARGDIVFGDDGGARHYGSIIVRDAEGNARAIRVARSGRARID